MSSCLEESPLPPVAMARRRRNAEIGGKVQLLSGDQCEDFAEKKRNERSKAKPKQIICLRQRPL